MTTDLTDAPTRRRTMRMVALGCAKNLVDSERVAGNFARSGYRLIENGPADVVVVTTCGFIAASAQESVDTLLEEIEGKKRGDTTLLVAAGCLPDRYRTELVDELTDLDLVVGVREMTRLPELADQWFRERHRLWEFSSRGLNDPVEGERLLSGPFWATYLKISDGCNQGCTFCTIPRIRGAQRSIPIPELIAEARSLADQGVVELSLVAQDLTSYGTDLDGRRQLVELLDALAGVEGLRWVRLMYAHPAEFGDDVIEAIASNRVVVPYLDVPFQHIADPMLASMNRHMDRAGHERLLERLRQRVPDMAIRTTLVVGAPGETEADFEELLAFVETARFDHLGAFAYSREEHTPAYRMMPQIDPDVAKERLDRLMRLQQRVSAEKLAERVGQEVEILVEEELAAERGDRYRYAGRCVYQAPEIDGITFLAAPRGVNLEPGDIVRGRIDNSSEYDLFATVTSPAD